MAAASSENMGLAANSRLPQPSRFGFGYSASVSATAPLQDITESQNNASMPPPPPQPSNKRPLSGYANQPEPKRKVLPERGGDLNFGGHKPSPSLSQVQASSVGATTTVGVQRPAIQGKSITSLASGSAVKSFASTSRPPSSASNFSRTMAPGSRQINSTSGRPPSSTNFNRSYQGRVPPGHHQRPATAQGNHRKGSDASSDKPPEGMHEGLSFTGIQAQNIGVRKQRSCTAALNFSHQKKRVVSTDLTDLAKDFAALGLQESKAAAVVTHRDRVVSHQQGAVQGSCSPLSHLSQSDARVESDTAHQERLKASAMLDTGQVQPSRASSHAGVPETPCHPSRETVDTLNAVDRLGATICSAFKTPGRRSKSCSPIKSDFLTKDSNLTNPQTAPAWMDERLKDVETQFSQMKEAMSLSLQSKSLLEDAVDMAKERANDLERERSRIVEQNALLKAEVEDVRQQAQSLTLSLDTEQRNHKYEVEDLKRNHRFALDELRRELKAETDRLQREQREALEALERHFRAEREDERAQRSKEVDALRARLGSEQQGLSKTIMEKDHDIQAMRSQLEEMKSDLDREHTLRGKLQQELVELSTINIGLDNRNRALRDQIEFLESGKKDQSDKFAKMDAALHEALKEAREARQRLIKEETERRILFNKYQELKGNIRVMCRVRPAAGGGSEGEEANIEYPDAQESSTKIEVTGPEEKSSLGLARRPVFPFEFDRVFTPAVQNDEVFGEISQLVQSALDGYNVCIFCYGQTGSGKTFTLLGPDPTFKCLSPDTMVRTTEGDKAIRDITIGTKLFGIDDMPVLCTAVDDIKTSATMRTVTYREWNSFAETSFECTSDHVLVLQAWGAKPYLGRHKKETEKRRVEWYTRCDRTELVREATDLQWDDLLYRLHSEVCHKLGRCPTDSEAHEYVDKGMDKFSVAESGADSPLRLAFDLFKSLIPPAELTTLDDDALIPLLRARIHVCIGEHLERSVPEQDEIPDNDEPDLIIDLDDIAQGPASNTGVAQGKTTNPPHKFRKLSQFPSSIGASDPSWRASSTVPSSALRNPNESQPETAQEQNPPEDSQGSSFANTAQIIPKEDHLQKFAAVRKQLSSKCSHAGGPCKSFRRVSVNFATQAQAELALELLSGDHYRVVDPYAVQNGDIFTMTVDEFATTCQGKLAKSKRSLKLFRAPLRFVPSQVPGTNLPVDPYFLGFWLGDGAKDCPCVSSSDLEIKSYLQAMVDRLNKTRPDTAAPMHITEHVATRAGDKYSIGGRTGFSKVTSWKWYIASPKTGAWWNPVRTGLRDLGFMVDNKRVGIPDVYMNADEDTRLAVIAGLLESDGTYVGDGNGIMYVFTQATEEHKKIVEDTRKLALSCGIQCTPITQSTNDVGSPKFWFTLTRGSEKFQHHLLLPRKKMGATKFSSRVATDAHVFELSGPHEGEYRAIEVSGGLFQLADRTVVHNCTSDSCTSDIKDDVDRGAMQSSPDGVIPRATKMIYEAVTRLREKSWTYEMDGSFIEVYNEELHDLLTPRGAGGAAAADKLEIKHDEARKQTSVTNCKVVRLDSADTVDTMLRQAAGNRSVAATKSNKRSSRSHSVFTLRLSGRNAATGEACEGTLNLVDLAGSERVKASGAEGDRMREAQNINRSLSCLGDVIEHLGKGSAHVPFRNSKLTHLLQYSLGGNAKGNSKTLMFVMVSPLEAHVRETLTSLRFAKKVSLTHIGVAKSSKKIRDRSSDS